MLTNRRDFLRYLGIAAAAAPLHGMAPNLFAGVRRPNIVVILADDHRHDAMSCAGHPYVETPAIDHLAEGGVRFTNAFVTTSLCSPSRASFLTGRYAHSHGITHILNRDLPANVPTYPEILRDTGYKTAFVGKWHLGAGRKPQRGFDRWVSFERQGVYRDNMLNIDGVDTQSEGYVTDVLTGHALDFLGEEHTDPFLLVLSHKAVHGPFEPAKRHAEQYEGEDPDLYFRPDPDKVDQRVFPEGSDYRDQRENVLDYYRCLSAVDESVGAVDEALARTGHADDTIVIYTSDNGFMLGEHGGMWDKRKPYEPSIRIPMIVRWPDEVAGGSVNREMVLNIDLMPSLLEAVGAKVPDAVQGRSWWPVLEGEEGRDAWLYEFFLNDRSRGAVAAVRTRRWKYIVPLSIRGERDRTKPLELYDLESDPGEERNLAEDPGHVEVLAQLQQRFQELQAEHGAVRRRKGRR